jgi:hypothetical protein
MNCIDFRRIKLIQKKGDKHFKSQKKLIIAMDKKIYIWTWLL